MSPTSSLPVGSWVTYNPGNDDPRALAPSSAECRAGQVRQAFTQQGQQYYQIVWNPGDMRPKVGMYHENQLTPISNQQAQTILQSPNLGTTQQ